MKIIITSIKHLALFFVFSFGYISVYVMSGVVLHPIYFIILPIFIIGVVIAIHWHSVVSKEITNY